MANARMESLLTYSHGQMLLEDAQKHEIITVIPQYKISAREEEPVHFWSAGTKRLTLLAKYTGIATKS